MTDAAALDPLDLGQRIVGLLESGRRVATYKLATLRALIDFTVEHLPAEAGAGLVVPIHSLATRVIDVYWPQVLPFEGSALRQTTQPNASILEQTRRLRSLTAVGERRVSFAAVSAQHRGLVDAASREVGLTLARQPLHRLQRIGAMRSTPFLYDDSWLHDGVSSRDLAAHGNAIELLPGTAWGLARLAGLLKPVIDLLWVDDVRRLNKHLAADVPDIAGHLFGRERVSLTPARTVLIEAYGACCFYCHAAVPAKRLEVDHVLPWSRIGLDGLTNLVLACDPCNSDKSNTLPAAHFVESALNRDADQLEAIARTIRWPAQRDRTIQAARGLYRTQPVGLPLWAGFRCTTLSEGLPSDWLRTA